MRRQLAVLVAATTLLVLIAFLVPLGLLLRSEAEQRALSTAAQRAQALAPRVADLDEGSLSTIAGDDFAETVFLPDQVIGVPAARDDAVALAASGRAFNAEAPGGVAVLVPVQQTSGPTAVIRIFVPDRTLHRGVLQTWGMLAGLGFALFLLGLLVADRLGRHLVGSVTALAATADRLARGDLSARVRPAGPPETRAVGAELNRLAGRIGELLAAEREEVADLAHRLRTPLTALRLNAEAIGDESLLSSVDGLYRAVDEVIRTARRTEREGAHPAADLAAVAAARVEFWSVLAEDTGRALHSDVPAEPVLVRASRADVEVALDALLVNVFAHTPDGTDLAVAVEPVPAGGGRLVVDDAGPGFADLDVLERGESGTGSTGLGLDIARRAALASGGDLRLDTAPNGGARVKVDFGPPA